MIHNEEGCKCLFAHQRFDLITRNIYMYVCRKEYLTARKISASCPLLLVEVRVHVLIWQEQPNTSSSPHNSVGHVYSVETIKASRPSLFLLWTPKLLSHLHWRRCLSGLCHFGMLSVCPPFWFSIKGGWSPTTTQRPTGKRNHKINWFMKDISLSTLSVRSAVVHYHQVLTYIMSLPTVILVNKWLNKQVRNK